MRKIFFSLVVFVFVFSFGINALADEGDSHEMDQNMDHDMDSMEHDMNMDHDMGNMDHDMDHTEASTHHHEEVVETPPNFKILGSYGAVNLSFILIGVWNKWIRRKVK